MNIYYDKDANQDLLRDKQIAVIGYGIQGFAQANNLRDSGCNVIVGLRSDSPSRAKAEKAGFEILDVPAAAKEADVVMVLVPDEKAASIYEEAIGPAMASGKYLAFSHGF